jgi:hypothetical protein
VKVRLILIGMVAALGLPLAAANGRAVFDPDLIQTGAGAGLERGAVPAAGNFGRHEDEDKGDRDHDSDRDHDGDRDHRGDDDRQCDREHKGDMDDEGDRDHKGDRDHHKRHRDHDGHDCDRSPSKPR